MTSMPPAQREEATALDSRSVEMIRQNCRKDLFFLSNGILGRPDVNLRTHGLMCRFMVEDKAVKKLLLMPRGHLKTAVATVDDGVRQALDNPDARVLFANEIDLTATAIMNEAKAHFEKNEMLRMFFPEYTYERYTGPGVKWSNDGAFLPNRTINDKTPTFMSVGVGGAITGMHFTCIKGDDLIGFESRESPTVMERTKRWINNLEPLLVSPQYLMQFIGTRWTNDDIYAHLLEIFPALAVLTRGCREDGEPIFPFNSDGTLRFTNEFFDDLQATQPDIYYAQYENSPLTGGRRDFQSNRVRDFSFDGEGNVVYNENGKDKKWKIGELDRVLMADPSGDKNRAVAGARKNDEAGISVVGVSPLDQAFSLDGYSGRMDPTQFVDKIYELACKWSPRIVGIEQAGLSTTLHYFEKKMRDNRRFFRTEALRPKNRVKHDRIRTTLEPVISTDRMFVPHNQRQLRSQIEFFPNIKEDAWLDCVGYYPEIAVTGSKVEEDKERAQRIADFLRMRNPITGY